MNYEFHVGDYVETWSGVIGHISKFEKWRHPAFIEDSVWFVYTTKKGNRYYFEAEVSQLKYEFRRIGAYDFTEKEKRKIEALTINKTMYQYTGDGTSNGGADYTAVYDNTKFQDKMIGKINELVDAVNLLLDKSTES